MHISYIYFEAQHTHLVELVQPINLPLQIIRESYVNMTDMLIHYFTVTLRSIKQNIDGSLPDLCQVNPPNIGFHIFNNSFYI